MDSCSRCKYQDKREDEVSCIGCIHNSLDNFKPMTNADRIRNMTDEELAEHFSGLIRDTKEHEYCQDKDDWLKWLKSEVGCE